MHPFIRLMALRYEQCIDQYSDDELVLLFEPARYRHERMLAAFKCWGGEDDLIAAHFNATVRYPLGSIRNSCYIIALATLLAERNLSLEVPSQRTLQLTGNFAPSSFPSFRDWEQDFHFMDGVVAATLALLQTAVLVSHLNYRLPDRSDIEKYEKLLPSHLAALTVCGMYEDVSVH